MSYILRIELIIFAILCTLLILYFVKKEKLLMRDALIWIIPSVLMIIAIMIPNLIEKTSILLGFEVTSNMMFLIGFAMLFFITFFLTIIISKQSLLIRDLVQELSILKSQSIKYNKK